MLFLFSHSEKDMEKIEDKQKQERTDGFVDEVRKKCLSRGFSNLTCFSIAFRQFDKDYSHEISFKEFKIGFRKYGISMTEEEEIALFKRFDEDG